MIRWINEGNHLMDARKKRAHRLSPQYTSKRLVSINYGTSQMTLAMSDDDKKNFQLRPDNLMFRGIAVGTSITISVNEVGEVIDLHVDSTSDVPVSGLNPDSDSALKRIPPSRQAGINQQWSRLDHRHCLDKCHR